MPILALQKHAQKIKNLLRSLGGQCRHQRPSKTLIIYSTQWEFSVSPSCIAFLTYYMPIYMWGSWWWGSYGGGQVTTSCQLGANVHTSHQPIWTQPKVSRGYTEHNDHCSNLVWAHGPQYAPPAAAYTWGSGIGGKVAI